MLSFTIEHGENPFTLLVNLEMPYVDGLRGGVIGGANLWFPAIQFALEIVSSH